MPKNIAVFGLGSMGFGVANSLLNEGHRVWGYDFSEEAVRKLCDFGGKKAKFADIAANLDVVIILVLNAKQASSLLMNEPGLSLLLSPGSVVINCTTVSPENARDMAANCEKKQIAYLDAPISGGAAKAMLGELSVMASGQPEAFTLADEALLAMAEKVFTIGHEAGLGSAMKAVNQMLAGVHIAAMAEATTFALAQGIDLGQCIDVISQSAGSSWMFKNRAPHVMSADYTPKSATNIWPKDLGSVMEIAKEKKFSAPLTSVALEQFNEAVLLGHGSEDDAAVAKVYAKENKILLPN
jgi:3-hydroxyisobutyrate dehydrogenase-like beta-hydroxyacid dehydrogenase